MKSIRYIKNVATLTLDPEKCVGCGMCTVVCPQGVLTMDGSAARIADLDGCMECGACAGNCPVDALSLTPGGGLRKLHHPGLAEGQEEGLLLRNGVLLEPALTVSADRPGDVSYSPGRW